MKTEGVVVGALTSTTPCSQPLASTPDKTDPHHQPTKAPLRPGGGASAFKPRLRLRQGPPVGAPGGSVAAPAPEGSLMEALLGLDFFLIPI